MLFRSHNLTYFTLLYCLQQRYLHIRQRAGNYSITSKAHFPLATSTMSPTVHYHCACLSTDPVPSPPTAPSSSYSFHPLHELFFCEECDAVRCNRCVSVEVSGYYCPNCLFEVPSASVRAEKNRSVCRLFCRDLASQDVLSLPLRCARNCFMCPNCRNTLSIVPSDPPDVDDGRSLAVNVAAVGEPPFFLYCNHCRWDSAEVDITFEKPTGLAGQSFFLTSLPAH